MPSTNSVCFLICFFVIFNALHVLSINLEPLALDCGSNGGKDEDGRTWESDSKFLLPTDSTQVQAGYQDPSLSSSIPYMKARIFKSPATYQFPVKTQQRYSIRLHFYPSSYSNFNASNSFFSVVAGGITLLSNFSAAITCQALTQAYLIKEYSLAAMDPEVLNITFTPSTNFSNSFAFVNGIELIPIPEIFGTANLVGFNDQTMDATTQNVQIMYRVNVGGQYIAPSNDSGGLQRSWYDDSPYLFGAAMGVSFKAADNVTITYGELPEYTAPVDVYKTARTMGPTADVNKQFNMTWLFQVDANFTYIVRLHFCEILFTKVNQRVFNIYVNNQSAQVDPNPADIIAWAGAQGAPIYKDYAIIVNDKPGDDMIQVDMSPSKPSKPEFLDIILNGIEVFKMSDANKNLAGPNPQPSDLLLKAEREPKRTFKPNLHIIGSAAGGAAVFGLVAALCIVVYKRQKHLPGTETHTSSWLPIYGKSNSHTTASRSTSQSSHLSNLAQGLCRHFSWAEMKQATKNFDESNVIGVGGFGKVYKGVIDGTTKVAIKRSNPSSEQGVNEFQTEIEMLSKLRHKHLVSLIGFCEDGGEMCLVYDYMARGTLREHIYNSKLKTHLPWKQRLDICIGAARGLHYLHTGAKYTIIHRDVKTTNILLDENWVAKVSDFGLSKTGPDMNTGHVSTVVKGSFGYLDPEYFRRQQLTEKSDVYSFGVVLFEVLCARPALNTNLPKEQVSLADWALFCQKRGLLEDIIDPHLKGKINPECLKKFADTAEKCLSDHGIERPSMGDVLWNLEFALQLQETADASKRGTSTNEVNDGLEGSSNNRNHSQRSEVEINEESDLSTTEIFPQISNPKGR
ncbi:hypothetical protein SLE2022_128520 [Rubroshorea leprosula]